MSVEEFPEYARRHWEGIEAALLEGTYTPSPVKRVEIPKDSGGTRLLGHTHGHGSCHSTGDFPSAHPGLRS